MAGYSTTGGVLAGGGEGLDVVVDALMDRGGLKPETRGSRSRPILFRLQWADANDSMNTEAKIFAVKHNRK